MTNISKLYNSMEELYNDNWKLVIVFFEDYIADWNAIEELSSMIWVRVFERQEIFLSMNKTWVKNYLRAMVRNLVNDYHKDEMREKQALQEIFELNKDAMDISSEMFSSVNLEELLPDAIEILSEEEKQLIMLKFRYKKSSEEIGKFFDISAGNVRVKQYRILRKLKKKMQELMLDERGETR